ncbi:MAG: nuclear transport factor 2 family protein [Alphaproteobacteria bacterium]|nr:nuclear transport factor 2 family protein [Alphaproteobacteria bacterium]
MSDAHEELLAANEAFYLAFARRDFEAMAALWSEDDEVACVHPGWDLLAGYREVIESWREILAGPGSTKVRCHGARVFLFGDVGCVVCHEVMPEGMLVATNLFRLEAGGWRMVHHHSGPLAGDVRMAERDTGPAGGTLH